MRWLAPLLLGLLLIGCGQKGDLYLPKDPAPDQKQSQQQGQP
ncbi:LPS translocon maturation chaperone LptM [Motiliproteus sp.]